MASGRPVVALGRGGATETVVDGVTGVFFTEQTAEAIALAVKSLASLEIDPQKIAKHASRFARDQFFERMRAHIDGLLSEKASKHLSRKLRQE
jgi:glycosyltransferase involved in cell wall biosynthesis